MKRTKTKGVHKVVVDETPPDSMKIITPAVYFGEPRKPPPQNKGALPEIPDLDPLLLDGRRIQTTLDEPTWRALRLREVKAQCASRSSILLLSQFTQLRESMREMHHSQNEDEEPPTHSDALALKTFVTTSSLVAKLAKKEGSSDSVKTSDETGTESVESGRTAQDYPGVAGMNRNPDDYLFSLWQIAKEMLAELPEKDPDAHHLQRLMHRCNRARIEYSTKGFDVDGDDKDVHYTTYMTTLVDLEQHVAKLVLAANKAAEAAEQQGDDVTLRSKTDFVVASEMQHVVYFVQSQVEEMNAYRKRFTQLSQRYTQLCDELGDTKIFELDQVDDVAPARKPLFSWS